MAGKLGTMPRILIVSTINATTSGRLDDFARSRRAFLPPRATTFEWIGYPKTIANIVNKVWKVLDGSEFVGAPV